MPRRFLTAEDVRRAGAGPLEVSPETVVTPHARQTAEELGVRLVTGSGDWVPAAPDRGPDAEGARTSMPHLPEPEGDDESGSIIVTVVGRNRPGVLAEVTKVLSESGASIVDISQRMIEGLFHMVLVVNLSPDCDFSSLKEKLDCLGGSDDYAVNVMHERAFRFMHRV